MVITAAICDDDKKSIQELKDLINTYNIDTEHHINIYEYTDPIVFLDATKDFIFDLIFLDIEMPGITGLDVAKQLNNKPNNKTEIIFVSNYSKYMQASFGVRPFYYFIKPYGYDEFKDILSSYISEIESASLMKLPITTKEATRIVNLKDILYISVVKGKKHQLEYHLDNEIIIGSGVFKFLETKLREHNFYIVHRGILANITKIHRFYNHQIFFSDDIYINLGRQYEKEIIELFADTIIKIR